MSDKPDDPYFYARHHDSGPGAWCVRGPNDFEMRVPKLDKSIAYIIGKLLSGRWVEAKQMLDTWCRFDALERTTAYDQTEECLLIWHGDGDHGWRVLKHQWPEAAITEQRRKMGEVIKRVRAGW